MNDDARQVSYEQRALWLLERLAPGNAANQVASAIRCYVPIDRAALRRGVHRLVDRHEILRTSFPPRDGRPVRHVASNAAIDFEAEDDAADTWVDTEANRPFDLERGPLFRVRVASRTDGWVVMICAHAIVGDRRTLAALSEELGELYLDETGGPAAAPTRLTSYDPYVAWQHALLASSHGDELGRFWDRLAGELPILDLFTDHARPPLMAYDGAELSLPLDAGLVAKLRALSAEHGVTLHTTVLTAYVALLHRTSGKDDVVIGCALPSTYRSSHLDTAGCFANFLPVRIGLDAATTVGNALSRVEQVVQAAVDHSDFPFHAIVDRIQAQRDASRTPMFQTTFEVRNVADDGATAFARGARIAATAFPIAVVATPVEIGLSVIEHGGDVTLAFRFNTTLYSTATITRLIAGFQCLLEGIGDPEGRIAELPILTDRERQQILVEWNDTVREWPRHLCVHDLFVLQAERTPDAIAVSFEGAALTYRELDRKANALAHRLRELGIGPDRPAAICVERSLEMIVAIFGVLKAGAAYVPLDPAYPPDRLGFMLRDSGVAVVVSQQHLLGGLRGLLDHVTNLEIATFLHDDGRCDAPDAIATPDDLAYIIYTSGSTGNPKGVMINHSTVTNFLSWLVRTYSLGTEDRVLLHRSPSFDPTVWELFGATISGGRVVIAKHHEPAYLVELIRDQEVTIATFNPTLLEVLLADARFRKCDALRSITCGAETLSPALQERFFALKRGELCNIWGTTETTVASTYCRLRRGAKIVPVGRPMDNTRLYILDGNLQPVPIGVTGEAYLGGDCLARGYLNRPDLTAARFVVDPFRDVPGARMYRTGDLARWLPDGNMEFLGRIDYQVKLRGYRIELGEIETTLARHPRIRDAVVLAREDAPGDKRLVAYIVVQADGGTGELRSYLKERLPDYMIPSAIVVLDAFPLTPNGKIDRKALPAPPSGRGSVDQAYVAPTTEDERTLASIWAGVLRLDHVGIHDDFFELGGHSLLATQVVSRIRDAFRVELPLRTMFEEPTVAGLAKVLKSGRATRSIPLVRVPREAALELSFAQQRLWFLDRLEPGNPFYNLLCPVRLRGELDVALLERCLRSLVARHESLRTTFSEHAGQAAQIIAPALELSVPLVDLTGLDADHRNTEALRLARAEARKPFDLERGPLLRTTLLRLGPTEHWLLITLHHIVADGWSFGVLMRELSELYRAGTDASLPALETQYADFAAWQRRWLTGDVLDAQLAYWKQQLAGVSGLLELPTDRPRPAVQSHRGRIQSFQLPIKLSAAVQELGRGTNATLFMTLLAAFQTLLHRYSRQDDIAIGAALANRNREETEGVIGFFVNTLVMRGDLSGDPTFRELLARTRDVALGAYSHQDVPFERLVEVLHPDRSLSHAPIFQVMFVLQNAPTGEALGGIEQDVLEVDPETAIFDFTLSMEERANGLYGAIEYSTDLWEVDTIARMIGHFERLLESIVANPDEHIERLAMLSEHERQRVLVDTNATARHYAKRLIHELIEEQAALAPDRTAVVFERTSLTYGELNARANHLAHHLRSIGVAPGAYVAVMMDRSFDLITSLLAVLKTGAAYVPLDPSYPRERLVYMLADSRPQVALVTAELRDTLPSTNARIVVVDSEAAIGAQVHENLAVDVRPDDLIYVIYTSGSTGRPKGAMNTHAGLANHLLWLTERFSFGNDERIVHKTPFSFDVSFWELFLPLTVGARVVMARPGGHQDPAYLVGLIHSEGATLVDLVPSLLAQILEVRDLERCTSLRRVFCGGEALPQTVAQRCRERLRAQLHNLYGPTEAAIGVSEWACTPDDPAIVPIGRPISNTQLYVLGPDLEPVPHGVAGEIHIGGVGLGRGYLDRPALTAERFIPDPFAPKSGGRLYKTGDLGRIRADGVIEFLGRIDHQVKVRGFRIELGEIEAELGLHPSVREAVVVVREDATGDKRLVAYVVGVGAVPIPDLRAHLKDRLPEYMVPSTFVTLDELPTLPSGKVDRNALPPPEAAQPTATDKPQLQPRTQTEELLASIWIQVLGIDELGVDQDFFELGGHSLLAMQIISRVNDAFQVELPVRAVFEAPTIAGFAGRIDELAQASTNQPSDHIPALPRDGELPLSFAEERLWFLDQLEPESPLYTVTDVVRLTGPLDVRALEYAFDELTRRHEILRTTYTPSGTHSRRTIGGASRHSIPVIDISGVTDRDAEVTRLAREDARRPFDIAGGPLLRVAMLRLATDEHVLLLAMHHIICDAWSVGVFWDELAAFYRAFTSKTRPQLEPLPIQYADYAAWQRTTLTGEIVERQMQYWKQQLANLPGLLELPTDRPRPPVQSYRGAIETFRLSPQVSAALKTLSQTCSVTLFMTLLAAFQTLLHRYGGATDISVGTPVANRGRADIEGLIGLFINTLVMRADVSGDPTFVELLARVREVALGAYNHQDVPFEKLVVELQPERSLDHSPLFQVMFVLQNTRAGSELPGIGRRFIEVDTGTAKFDLTLFLVDEAEGLRGAIEYNLDLYDAATITRMVGHLERLLEGIVADPDQPISKLPLLTPVERQELVVDWNATARDLGEPATIHELVEQQVDRTPDGTAVVAGEVKLSYARLDARANRLAHHLIEHGAGPGVLVGIFLDRGIDLVVALLGVLKTGAAYVPLDPTYPTERLAFIHEDARPKVLVTEAALARRLPDLGAHVVRVDADADAIARTSANRPSSAAGIDSLSHVIYTSGSTGRPKGVAIEHRVMVNYVRFSRELHPRDELGAFLFATSVCFDMSLFELLVPLTTGGHVYVVEDLFSLPALGAVPLTFVNAVPSVLSAYLRAGRLPPTLEAVSCAGEPLPNSLVRKLHDAGVHRVYDFYGPTETFIATWSLRSSDGTPTIGRPIANAQVYLLDANGALVPRGLRGELYVGGDGLAREYLHRPELTRERFVPNPFGPGRLYRTGDIARWLPDGSLAYLGRVDHQVKIRGFRVEPGEIEVVLGGHAGIREAAVVAREDTPGDKRLVAYVVGKGEAPSISDVRSFLKERLPDYMVPSAFVVLDALPQTPNGKIDRKALPAPEAGRAAVDRAYVAPRTSIERRIAEIWSEVLGVEQVGVHDNFFELGGHSLLATQVVSRVRTALEIDLPLRSLFEAASVADFADLVAAAAQKSPHTNAPITPIRRNGDLPLSFAQQRLWFVDQLEPGSPLYHLCDAVRLRGTLDTAALQRGLSTIVARHEALRTTFAMRDGHPLQIIAPAADVVLARLDVDGEVAMMHAIDVEAVRPFDLERGPLLRATLLRLGPAEHVLVLAMHHIVFDGWSFGVLWRELATLYRAFASGGTATLPPLPIQYADFASWQRQWLTGDVLADQLHYWKRELRDTPTLLELPTDRPRPAVMGFAGATHSFTLPSQLVAALHGLGRGESATLFMTLLAAFQVLLHRYSRQHDIVVGSPVANRNRHETEELIGFFVNTLVLRGDLSGNPTFCELLRRTRETTLAAYAHQDVPFEKLVEELQPVRSLSFTPLFQVMFVVQNTPEAPAMPGLDRETIDLDGGTAKFDLTLVIEERADGAHGWLEYSTDLFDAVTIERLAAHFVCLLEGIVADPDQPVSGLPLLGERERHQVLAGWNDTARPFPRDKTVHGLFEAQVDRSPDATAIVFESESLTYRELDRRANQLAHHLRDCGVEPDSLVGICVDRSLDMVIALLGIMKAGGAYVPLDPGYPAERLAFMMEDAAVSVLVTQDRLVAGLPPHGARVVRIDRELPALDDRRPTVAAGAENLAYVDFTSGSTGRPKGACVPHRAVVRLVCATNYLQVRSDDVFLQLSPLAFDASTLELWGPLLHGAKLVVFPAHAPTLDDIARIVVENRVTVLWLTAALYHQMIDHRIQALAGLRCLLAGGDVLSVAHVRRTIEQLQCTLINGYGPTENTTFTCCYVVPRPLRIGASLPIGPPIANTTVYILDAERAPVPIGVPGELYTGGDGVARGYLRRPELTAEKFIANPFGPGRLYRTGDLARWLPDGNVEFLGRIDQQVKIRGFRIELGEIESVLARMPGIREAVVLVSEETGDKRLIAYVVGADIPSASELRAGLKTTLPDYMLPAHFIVVPELPVTPNGKIDRKALLHLRASQAHAPEQLVPRTRTELELARIFAELLGVPSVGARDDFFELGGHSLLAIQLCSAIQSRLGATLPVSALFRAPTVEALARDIAARPANHSTVVPLRAKGSRAALLCVHPGGGTVFCYQQLVARLAGDRPCFGLEAKGLDNGETPIELVEEMARIYTSDVLATHAGPFHVMGWSFGGLVALEMAHVLRAAGHAVVSTTLIDSFAPAPAPGMVDPTAAAAEFAHDLGLAIDEHALRDIAPEAVLSRLVDLAHSSGALPGNLGVEHLESRLRVFAANLAARDRYVPRRSHDHVVLIRAADTSEANGVDPAVDWRRYLDELDVRIAPGHHLSMVQPPHVDELARLLDEVIGQA